MLNQKLQPKPLEKKPKLNKKEQLKEETRLRKLVKEQIFPILLKNAKTVKDAKSICQTVMVGLDAVFMEKIKEYQAYLSEDKLNMLKLQTWMNDRKQYPAEWELVELLDQETISCAKTLLQGMEAELTRLTDKQPLETLETEWL